MALDGRDLSANLPGSVWAGVTPLQVEDESFLNSGQEKTGRHTRQSDEHESLQHNSAGWERTLDERLPYQTEQTDKGVEPQQPTQAMLGEQRRVIHDRGGIEEHLETDFGQVLHVVKIDGESSGDDRQRPTKYDEQENPRKREQRGKGSPRSPSTQGQNRQQHADEDQGDEEMKGRAQDGSEGEDRQRHRSLSDVMLGLEEGMAPL